MEMEKLIACCGMNCAACDARIATVTNDNALRAKKADEWKVLYNAPDITPEMINCNGCREAGVKIEHCKFCEIKNCALSKNYQTCSECDKLENCPTLNKLLQYVPDALANLKSLN
jgi:hypothetical protein